MVFPGTMHRVRVLQDRLARGQCLFHHRDASVYGSDRLGYVGGADTKANFRVDGVVRIVHSGVEVLQGADRARSKVPVQATLPWTGETLYQSVKRMRLAWAPRSDHEDGAA